MYMLYAARRSGDSYEQGPYVALVYSFEEARQIIENENPFDGFYDCFMIESHDTYWLMMENGGGWDFFYEWGDPLIVNADGLVSAWYAFESDADEGTLLTAQSIAPNGSCQAIFDAYCMLDPSFSYYTG